MSEANEKNAQLDGAQTAASTQAGNFGFVIEGGQVVSVLAGKDPRVKPVTVPASIVARQYP